MKKEIYLDNAATTRIRPEVAKVMIEHLEEAYGNPSSVYKIARENKNIIEENREKVAKAINAEKNEIYFTGGGSESNNWALKGIAESYKNKGKHIITTNVEHHAILHVCNYLETIGYEVTYLPVDEKGNISLDDLKNAIRKDTILISIMFANNEIGTINPIAEIGAIAKENGILFHTDAVQATGHTEIDVKAMNIDLLSMSAHKFYGPKGIGALYIKKGIKITPLIHGGGQERSRRAGTENIVGIIGMGTAIELAIKELKSEEERLTKLRDKFIDGILEKVPYCWLNGTRENRMAGNCNISFEFIEGESILLLLDMNNICASSGSACTSGSLDPSHVLLAIGLPHEKAHGSLRVSLGLFNTEEDVDYLLEKLPPIVARMREMSPLYEEFVAKQKADK
ncbi:MAG: cysteine desulfurase NifS [Eubacteriales bacterium]|nr:cysteine desulfurase NifS [Eubacteriales bacterium]